MNYRILSVLDLILGNFGLAVLVFFLRRRRNLPEPEKVENITVLKFLGYGSLILAAPALYAVKKHYPKAKLILYTTSDLQQNAGILKIFDEVILLDPIRPFYSLRVFFRAKSRFKAEKTLIINLEFFSKTAVFICGFLRGAYTLSLSLKTYRLLDLCIVPDDKKSSSIAEIYDLIAESLGCRSDSAGYAALLQSSVGTRQRRIIIAPFCSNLSLRRMWNPEKWGLFISGFCDKHPEYSVAVIGAPANRLEAEKIINVSGKAGKVHNFCGEISFSEAFSLIRSGSCFCGIDSAPLHLARLAAVPSVSLWGATDPHLLTRDFPGYPEVIIFARQHCSPCVHTRKKCHLPGGCLNTVSPDMVIDAVSELLKGGVSGRKTVYPEKKRK